MARSRRTSLLVAALALTAAAASACNEVDGTNGKNFVTGDSSVTEITVSDRGSPVDVSGTTLDGDQLDLADWRGSVVVVNVWGSWCSECIVEAPTLVAAYAEFPAGTKMVGIDVRDGGQDAPRSFEEAYGVPYPSIYDPGSETLLDFDGPFHPRDIPSTMVLDRTGRVAALIRGRVPSKLTLTEVVQKVSDEDGQSDG